jgi:mRNA interferase RelE/StbE
VSYALGIPEPVREYLRRQTRELRRRIGRRLDEIQADPHGPIGKQLTARGRERKARVGDYRIIFRVDDTTRTAYVLDVGPRQSVYRS